MHELYKESEVKASEANKECQEGLQKVGGEMAGVVGEVRGNGTRTGLTERFDGMRNAAQEVIEKTFRGVQECPGADGRVLMDVGAGRYRASQYLNEVLCKHLAGLSSGLSGTAQSDVFGQGYQDLKRGSNRRPRDRASEKTLRPGNLMGGGRPGRRRWLSRRYQGPSLSRMRR